MAVFWFRPTVPALSLIHILLFLLLCAIPVSAYLASGSASMKGQLALIGVGKGTLVAARILGVGMLFLSVALCTALGASFAGLIEFSLPGLAALVMVCLGAASLVVFLYQAAGSLMGGVMPVSYTHLSCREKRH